jgi:hypothetical protein
MFNFLQGIQKINLRYIALVAYQKPPANAFNSSEVSALSNLLNEQVAEYRLKINEEHPDSVLFTYRHNVNNLRLALQFLRADQAHQSNAVSNNDDLMGPS